MPTIKRLFMAAALLTVCSGAARADSLFDDLGGLPGIDRLVTQSMAIWKNDSRVAPTFEDTNLVRFRRLFIDQLCMVTGGGCTYTGRSMAEAHKGLHLATVQFNAVAEDMQTAMEQMGVASSVQNRLLARLAPMQRDVVTR